MSFTLKSIELKNIKTHEYLLFEPALEGITAISGENGSGKSTIVDSLAWCLYGTRPSGVKNKNFIKEKVDPKKKPVSVKTVLFVGGIEYIIEKKIITPAGTTECNVWGKRPESEVLSHVAGPAVSHVEKFIRSELGMNEKGFLTSVLIQQKQVDQIVSASPRERGIVIEELTGIASITQAIMKTNDNVRALEKAASIFTIGNIEEAKEKVKKQKSVCKNIDKKEKAAIKMFNEMKVINKETKDDLDIQQTKVNQRIKLNQEVDKLKGQIDFLKKQADDDINYILNFKKKYGTTIYIDVADIKKKVESKRKESYSINNVVNNIN
ncbi:MAG TPA: AAA family ATPase, partial [Clostridiales bacterium]|nr:AAA family ATPase [Clostridiales bacterium]